MGQGRRLIGGAFESPGPGEPSPGVLDRLARGSAGTWCASGRAALELLLGDLRARGIERVLLPAFVCESVVQAVEASGLPFDFYPVGLDLGGEPDPAAKTAVLLIHYFGWRNALGGTGDPSWIEDLTMVASSPGDAPERSWFFSVRKIGAAPLGGWCSAESILRTDELAETMFRTSMRARKAKFDYLGRSAASVDEATERSYLRALEEVERDFERLPADAALPDDALHAIEALDLDEIARLRRKNWSFLHEEVQEHVDLLFPDLGDHVPLGYVIRLDAARRDAVRAKLAEDRIFCPAYWPLPQTVDGRRFPDALALSQTLLTLPIDQRYGDADMGYLAERLLRHLDGR